jgi:hypothetical protein
VSTFGPAVNEFAIFGVSADEIRWTGAPYSGWQLRESDIFAIPFSLLWSGGVFSIGIGVLSRGSFEFPELIIVFMMCLGVYVTVGRFIWDAYVRSNTRYALTDDTAFVVRRSIGGKNSSTYLPTTNNITYEPQSNGWGSIYFGTPALRNNWNPWNQQLDVVGFLSIPEVADVYARCRAAQTQRA